MKRLWVYGTRTIVCTLLYLYSLAQIVLFSFQPVSFINDIVLFFLHSGCTAIKGLQCPIHECHGFCFHDLSLGVYVPCDPTLTNMHGLCWTGNNIFLPSLPPSSLSSYCTSSLPLNSLPPSLLTPSYLIPSLPLNSRPLSPSCSLSPTVQYLHLISSQFPPTSLLPLLTSSV